jgi:flagellar biosynthesis protein FliR
MQALLYLEHIYQNIIGYSLIFTRVFAAIYTVSMFRRDMATTRFVITLSAVLSFYVLTMVKMAPIHETGLSFSLLMQTMQQGIIGFASGLVINLIFEVFVSAGQIASMQIGLSTASLFDPRFGMVTSLSQFYLIVGMVLFLNMNGHLILIEAVVNSFTVIPIGKSIPNFLGGSLFQYAGIIFVGGVAMSIILIAITLLTNICLAVMSKFAPQFNLFSVGINMTLVIGLITLFLSFNLIADRGAEYVQQGLNALVLYFKNVGAL